VAFQLERYKNWWSDVILLLEMGLFNPAWGKIQRLQITFAEGVFAIIYRYNLCYFRCTTL